MFDQGLERGRPGIQSKSIELINRRRDASCRGKVRAISPNLIGLLRIGYLSSVEIGGGAGGCREALHMYVYYPRGNFRPAEKVHRASYPTAEAKYPMDVDGLLDSPLVGKLVACATPAVPTVTPSEARQARMESRIRDEQNRFGRGLVCRVPATDFEFKGPTSI